MSSTTETLKVGVDDGEVRLDRYLRRKFPKLTQVRIEKLLRSGQIRVDGGRAKSSDRVGPGQEVRLPPAAILYAAPPPKAEHTIVRGVSEDVRKMILFEDHDVLVVNKPFGVPTQGGTGIGDKNMDDMVAALGNEGGSRPKLVHRLDRDTTGVLVFGKTPVSTAALAESFRNRDTMKVYWAIVLGMPRPATGQIRSWMRKEFGGPGQSDREMMRPAIQKDEGALHAITDYLVLQNAGQEAAWMALRPVTGRTHQLRFHMQEIGNSIAGDSKYKCDRQTPGGLGGKLLLHARAIELPHPKKGNLRVIAPTPAHMQNAFELLGFDERDAKDPFEPFI